MSAQDVYEALRRGAEQAAVKLNESQDDPLTFTSEFYGKNSNLSITVDNDQLRQYLGIDAEVDGTYIPANASPVSTAQEGIIKINDTEVAITAGMTGDQVYSAIASAAAAEGITLSGNTDPLAFVSSNPFKISINNENLKSYLGISSTSYAVAKTVYGEDADVTLTRSVVTGTSVTVGFGKQATLAQDGNHFVISDTQGFEMNFSVEAGYVGDINMEVTDIGPMTLQIGANENQNMTVRIPSVSAEDMYLDKIDVTKSGGAERAIKTLDEAIARVSEIRSEMGAAQNRLETTVSSLDQTDENMNNAVSRIEDSDMAEEMTEYTKYNVLQQAATSVLSQANEIPQMALQLLQ
jgi:flagellin